VLDGSGLSSFHNRASSEICMNFRRGVSGVLEVGASEPQTAATPLLAGGFRLYGVSEGPEKPPARNPLASGHTVPEAPRLPEAPSCNWIVMPDKVYCLFVAMQLCCDLDIVIRGLVLSGDRYYLKCLSPAC
jgi:hypothetical protein